MKRFIFLMFLFFTFLFANSGLEQEYLISYKPMPNEENISEDIILEYKFAKEIDKNSINKDTITLKYLSKKIDGKVSIKDNNTLVFTPKNKLKKGNYSVRVKAIKLISNKKGVQPKSWFERFIAWICSIFYDDINNCPLCKFVCNIKIETIKSKEIKYNFKVTKTAPKVLSLLLTPNKIDISENNESKIKVIAKLDDNSSLDVTKKAKYISNNSSVAIVKDGVLKSFSEGSAEIKVSYKNKNATLKVEVYEMVDNHLLPHAPKNPDATLLGVDANNNGVRDDVERWIYKKMPTYYHPEIERVVAMTAARAYQMALKDPSNKDDKVLKAIDRASDCWAYYSYIKDLPINENIEKFFYNLKDKQFNTKERLKTFMDYDYSLKGRVFTLTPLKDLNSSFCDEDIDKLP